MTVSLTTLHPATDQDSQSLNKELAHALMKQFSQAQTIRRPWESHWQECYDYALPQRQIKGVYAGGKNNNQIFDATALHAVDQLAASLLSELTPPWSRWFTLIAGPEATDEQKEKLQPLLEQANTALQDHFDRSNFAVEMHQAFLDLIVAGTGSLLFEEKKLGAFSAFQFRAVPLSQLYVMESEDGVLDLTFRTLQLNANQIKARFGQTVYQRLNTSSDSDDEKLFALIEAVTPDKNGYRFVVLGMDESEPHVIEEGHFQSSPYINFRWSKTPSEIYGRSPVMTALPDIKTANKVVELILKNASIAVTGIWQADDDGVLNPATIKLVPGTIIPKAVGSAGLKPLEMPGKFDVSQLVLDDLRQRIIQALHGDHIHALHSKSMTATEVLERSSSIARLMGAIYGRLQSELLTPLIMRAYTILRRRGIIADFPLDGRLISLCYTSPLAKAQAGRDMQLIIGWIEKAMSMGPQGAMVVDTTQAARHIGKTLGVPPQLIRDDNQPIKGDEADA